jgi:hypothetical protein
LRPRLALLVDLLNDVGDFVRRRLSGGPASRAAGDEQRSADEMRRRLDQTRARLRREHPPAQG